MNAVADLGLEQRHRSDALHPDGREPAVRARVRTVVCGVGVGDEAGEVTRVAHRLSERLPARLVLVHIAADPARAGSAGFPPFAQEELHRAELDRARKHLGTVIGDSIEGDHAVRRVAFGPPAAALEAIALEEDADLLVVGSRGRRGVTASLLGSVSAELVRSAPCPVVVVGPNVRTV